MTDESETLPTFGPAKPIGKCGLCGNKLYAYSTCQSLVTPDACPLYGDEWRRMKMMLAMQNCGIR